MSGATDGCGTRVVSVADLAMRIKALEEEVAKWRTAFHREGDSVDALHDRAQELDAENEELKRERESLRKLVRDAERRYFAAKKECESQHKLLGERQAFPAQYVSQGCVCPADAQLNCNSPTCPRQGWTVATSQSHHRIDWSRDTIGPDSW